MEKKKTQSVTPYRNLSEIRKLLQAYHRFVSNFELVFHDDWEHTSTTITDPLFVKSNETFLNSAFGDHDPWSNRRNLLESYEKVKSILGEPPAWEM